MSVELRSIGRDEAEAFIRAVYLAFGNVVGEQNLARGIAQIDPKLDIAAYDQGRIVGTAGGYSFELTLPAAAGVDPLPTIPVAGLTAVGVLPTHRRRGILTRLMNYQIQHFRDQGFAAIVLLASESAIYGRFGYGLATDARELAIETHHSAFRPQAAAMAATGRMRMIDADEATKVLPAVLDGARRRTPGELSRTATWWTWHVKDFEHERVGGRARLYAVHESDDGVADGWVSYRVKDEWATGAIPRFKLVVNDLVAANPAVRAALWRLVLDVDLVEEVTWRMAPVDDPLRWLLADPRRVRTTELADHLWVRLLDIPAALSARGYGASERLVIEVAAPDPAAVVRFVLETSSSSGEVRVARPEEQSQLVLGLEELGAIYLGGVAPSVLAAAGRVIGREPGVLAVADRVFHGPLTPYCSLFF